jgi:hypothetical protein
MSRITVFDYPPGAHQRRHGPSGYADYASYRDWLRDDFCFRCVFCLRREQWDRRLAAFHIDHFIPQHADPSKGLEYGNLLYVCASCNSVKGELAVPNPCDVNYGECLQIRDDGSIEALNPIGRSVVGLLALDDPDATRYRKLILDTLRVLRTGDDQRVYEEWIRFPSDLPDLSRKQAPAGNSRPQGIADSWFARRVRGELPRFILINKRIGTINADRAGLAFRNQVEMHEGRRGSSGGMAGRHPRSVRRRLIAPAPANDRTIRSDGRSEQLFHPRHGGRALCAG